MLYKLEYQQVDGTLHFGQPNQQAWQAMPILESITKRYSIQMKFSQVTKHKWILLDHPRTI